MADGFLVSTAAGFHRLAPGMAAAMWDQMPAPPDQALAVRGGLTLLTMRNGFVAAVSAADGSLLWQADLPAAITAIVAGGRQAYIATAAGIVQARAYDSDTVYWRRELTVPLSAVLAVADGENEILLAMGKNGTVYGLAHGTGEVLWTLQLPAPLSADPAAGGDLVCCPLRDGTLAFIDWRQHRIVRASDSLPVMPLTPVWDGGQFIIAAGGLLTATVADSGWLWRVVLPAPATAAPLVTGNGVWLALGDGTLRLYAAADGTELRNWPLQGPLAQRLVGGQNGLLLLDRQQHVLLLAAAGDYQDAVDSWPVDTDPVALEEIETPAVALASVSLAVPVHTPEGWDWQFGWQPAGYQPLNCGLIRLDGIAGGEAVPGITVSANTFRTGAQNPPAGWYALVIDGCQSSAIFADHQSPAVSLQAQRAGAKVQLIATVHDDGQVASRLELADDAGGWLTLALADGSGTTAYGQFDSVCLAQWDLPTAAGEQQFRLFATDDAGNNAVASAGIVFDCVPPDLTIALSGEILEAEGATVAAPGCQVVAAADDNDGLSPVIEYRDVSGIWNIYAEPLTFSANGGYGVSMRATDAAGNVSAVQDVSLTIDALPPTGLRLAGVSAGMLLGMDGADFMCVADDSLAIVYQASLTDQYGGQLPLAGQGPAFAIPAAGLQEDKYYTLTVVATDAFGNAAVPLHMAGIYCDLTPPLALTNPATPGIDVLTVSSGNGYAQLKTGEDMRDAGTGLAQYLIFCSEEESFAGSATPFLVVPTGNSRLDYCLTAPPQGGPYYFAVAGRDKAGNVSSLSCIAGATFPVDQTAPTAGFGLDPRGVDLTISPVAGEVALDIDWRADMPYDLYGIDHYEIYRRADSPVTAVDEAGVVLLQDNWPGDEADYRDSAGLQEGRRYYYAVLPVDAAGNKGDWLTLPLAASDISGNASMKIAGMTLPDAGCRVELWGGDAAMLAAFDSALGWLDSPALATSAPLRVRIAADAPAAMPTTSGPVTLEFAVDGRWLTVCLPDNSDGAWGEDVSFWVARDGSTWHVAPDLDALAIVGDERYLAKAVPDAPLPAYSSGIPDATPPVSLTLAGSAGVEGLTATAMNGAVTVDWSADPPTDNVGLQAIEVWRRSGDGEERMIAEDPDYGYGPAFVDAAAPGNVANFYRVRGRDATGNVQVWSDYTDLVTVADVTPPVAMTVPATAGIDGPVLTLTTTGGVMVDWQHDPASDPSGIAAYRVYRAPTSFSAPAPPSALVATVPPPASGELCWHDQLIGIGALTLYYAVTAVDGCGNEGELAPPLAIVVPDRPPVITLALTDNALVRGTLPVSGTITDNQLLRYECAVDTGIGFMLFAAGTVVPANGVLGTLNTAKLPDGVCRIRVTAFAAAGLNATKVVPIRVDNTAPAVTVSLPATNFVVRDELPLSLIANDAYGLRSWLLAVTAANGDTLWQMRGATCVALQAEYPIVLHGANGKITLRWQIIDAAGNVKNGTRVGALMNSPPAAAPVLITELDMTPDEGPRWAELTAVAGPVNIAGWKMSDLDGTDMMLAAKAVTLQTGDVVAVCWGEGDDEVDKTGGGWDDLNENGVRDLYVSDPAPNTTDDQLAMLNGDIVIDAVAISDFDGSLPSDEMTDMGWLYDRWGWHEDGRIGGQQVAVQLMLPGWGSIGRIPGAPDSGRKADWVGMRPSPGLANAYVAPPAAGSVLINEVKIDDFFDTEQDWVELYCVNGPVDVGSLVLGDLDTIEEERLLSPAAPLTLQTGQYCVIHLLPVMGENETDNDASGGWTDANGNGIRDLYAPMTQLPATDDQLVLHALDGTMVDAMCWSDRDGGIAGDEEYDNFRLVDAGAWQGDGGQYAAAYLRSHIYTLGRSPNANDSNHADDWQPCAATPGVANQAIADDHVPPRTWLESWGPMVGDGTDTYIANWTQFYMRSFDDLSGVAEKRVSVDGAPEQLYGDPIVLATESWHTVCYWGIDNAGNVEPAHTLRLCVDITPPQVMLSLDTQNRLVIAVTDAVAGVENIQFSHAGQSMEDYAGPSAFYGAGEYQVRYEVRDRVGNITTGSQAITVPELLLPPTLAEVPELTNIANLNVSGEAVSGAQVVVERNGSEVVEVATALREVTISPAAFTERSDGIIEEGGFLTLQPYTELWADDFEDGDYSGWTVRDGNWQVENGVLVGRSLRWLRLDHSQWVSAPTYSITGQYRNITNHAQTIVAFNVDNQFNMYRLLTFGQGVMALNKNVATVGCPIISEQKPIAGYQLGAWQSFRIDKFGDGRMLLRVGETSVEGVDPDYQTGFCSLHCWDGNPNRQIEVNYDNLQVFTGSPAASEATAIPVELATLGRIASIAVSLQSGGGSIDLFDNVDPASRTPLYRLVGQTAATITPYLAFIYPQPVGERPRCGLITLRGMADYASTVSLHEGENRLLAYAEDGAGNRSAPSEERIVILDTQEPVLAGISISHSPFTPGKESATLALTLADNLADRPGSLRVAVRNAAGAEIRELLNAVPAAYGGRSLLWNGCDASGAPLAAGTYQFVIHATDAAGNQASASAAVVVQYDVTPPAIVISAPLAGAQLSYAQTLTPMWTVSDTESGVAGSSATLDGRAVAAGTAINLQTLGMGSHTLAVTAADVAGNSGTAGVTFSVIDDVPPTITLQQPATPTNQDVTLAYTAADAITPANQLVIAGNASPYTAEGSHAVALTVTDAAGNSATSNTVTFVIDKTAPVCGITLDLTDSTGTIAVPETLLDISATDTGCGVAGIEYQLNGGAWQPYGAPFELKQANVTQGVTVIACRAADHAGNVSAEQSKTVMVKPALEVSVGLLNAPRVLAWWNEPADGQHPSKEAGLAALRSVLDSAALDCRIVESAADFTAALGDFNVYLILGDLAKIDAAGDSLVAAQVALGKSLVSFGYDDIATPESTDRGWMNIFGVKVAGVLNGTSLLAINQGPLGETQTITAEGRSERITEVNAGEVWGEIALIAAGEGGHGEGGGHHADSYPSIVANGWGMGRTLYAVPEYSRNLDGLSDVLHNAIIWATPAREVVVPGGLAALRITVKNAVLPMTLRVNVEALVPPGGDVVAVYDDGEDRGNVVTWFDDLAATATGEYRHILRLPTDGLPVTVRVWGAYLRSGSYPTVVALDFQLP